MKNIEQDTEISHWIHSSFHHYQNLRETDSVNKGKREKKKLSIVPMQIQ